MTYVILEVFREKLFTKVYNAVISAVDMFLRSFRRYSVETNIVKSRKVTFYIFKPLFCFHVS